MVRSSVASPIFTGSGRRSASATITRTFSSSCSDEKVHGLRLHVIQRAEQLGNVSQACQEAGISRALFYRWRKRLERYGPDGVHPRRHQARPGRPVQLAPETERLLLSVAVSAATWGASRIAAYLQHRWQVRVAPSTVQRALRRAGLATRRQRLIVLEQRAVQTAGLLTERTRRALWHAQHAQPRHVAAREPGELVCLDTFYIGQLKGVGKVWQITALGDAFPQLRRLPVGRESTTAAGRAGATIASSGTRRMRGPDLIEPWPIRAPSGWRRSRRCTRQRP